MEHFIIRNTTQNGVYIVTGIGDYNGEVTIWNYDFIITPNGDVLDISSVLLLILITLLITFILISTISTMIKTNSYTIKVVFFDISYLIVLSLAYVIWYVATNFIYTLPILSSLLYYSWFILLILIFPMIIVSISLILISNLQQKNNQKLLSMGYSTDDANKISRRK
jgi:hypothetical protein